MNSIADIIKIVRRTARPTALEYVDYIFDDFMEFHGDRLYGDDKAVIGGIAMLDGMAVTVTGIQKGHTIEENMARNFGSAHPEGYRKALRLMKQAEKFNRPVVNFINTAGAFCGIGAEERGQGEAIARNLMEMSMLKVPVISVIIGEGGSGGALALAVADQVWMLENAVYSILSPEGFASILWKDAKRAEEAARLMKMTAYDLYDMGIIDRIIKEDEKGAEFDFQLTAEQLKTNLIKELCLLRKMDTSSLLNNRYNKFRSMGTYIEME